MSIIGSVVHQLGYFKRRVYMHGSRVLYFKILYAWQSVFLLKNCRTVVI